MINKGIYKYFGHKLRTNVSKIRPYIITYFQ